MKELILIPGLSISLEWSGQMNEVWRKRCLDLWFGRPCADEQLCQVYNHWQKRLKACYWHIQCYFKLTGNLPVVGDFLHVLQEENDWKYSNFHIVSRTLFTCLGDDSILVTYEVQSKYIEDLETQLDRAEQGIAQV